jgi:hypothetical protein
MALFAATSKSIQWGNRWRWEGDDAQPEADSTVRNIKEIGSVNAL